MKTDFEILGEWDDDLIWCPSQCYLNIRFKAMSFCLYLRWRHGDPWTAALYHQIQGQKDERHELSIDYFKDSELEELKKHATNKAKEYLNRNF